MKKKDLKDIRIKEIKEINNLADKKRAELLELIVKKKSSGEKNFKKAKNLRKDIAQILTVIREKELNEEETDKQSLAKSEFSKEKVKIEK